MCTRSTSQEGNRTAPAYLGSILNRGMFELIKFLSPLPVLNYQLIKQPVQCFKRIGA